MWCRTGRGVGFCRPARGILTAWEHATADRIFRTADGNFCRSDRKSCRTIRLPSSFPSRFPVCRCGTVRLSVRLKRDGAFRLRPDTKPRQAGAETKQIFNFAGSTLIPLHGTELHLDCFFSHRFRHSGGPSCRFRRCGSVSRHHGLDVRFGQDCFRDLARPDRSPFALARRDEDRRARRSRGVACARA